MIRSVIAAKFLYCAQQPALFHGTVADDLQFPFTIRHQKCPVKKPSVL